MPEASFQEVNVFDVEMKEGGTQIGRKRRSVHIEEILSIEQMEQNSV